jgi:hypothetical protein
MTDSPSWRLKLHRAEEYFRAIGDLIGYPAGRQPCPVTEVVNADGEFEYSISIPGEPDPMIAIVAGDCLFNIRSALDHLLCALIPGEDKGRAQFPIFTSDPLSVDLATGRWRDTGARNRWRSQVKGVPDGPLAVITELQPYKQAGNDTENAQHHSFAVLQSLQNADKHRQLVFHRPGLKHAVVRVPGAQDLCIVPSLYDGARIFAMDCKMDVELEGVISVPFSVGDGVGYEYPLMFNLLLDFIANEVLPALEPFVPPSLA